MNIEKEMEYLAERGASGVLSESCGDYSLPDYNTDVKRILQVKARPVPSSMGFIDGDSAEYSGIVEYEVVYLDSENNLTSCAFTTDYELAMKTRGESAMGTDIRTGISGASIRLTGPRRLSARAQLVSDVHLTECDSLNIDGDAITDGSAEVKTGEARIAYSIYSEPQEREYAEELARLDGVISDEVTLLSSDCVARVEDVEAEEGSCAIKGVMEISALVKPEGECAQCYKKQIPFEQKIELEGLTEGKSVIPSVTVTSHKVSVDPTEDGVILSCSVICESRVRALSNATHSIPTDTYNRKRGVENEYEDFSYLEHIATRHHTSDVSGSVALSEIGCENMRNAVYLTASPRLAGAVACDGGVKISGDVRFSGIACQINEEGELTYCGIKYDLPFEQNVKLDCHIPDDAKVDCALVASSFACDANSDYAEFSVRLDADITLLGRRKMKRLASSEFTDEVFEKEENAITVYYPTEDETLFDIAKRFHTSPIEIAADNSFTEEVFALDGEKKVRLGKLIIR